MNLPGSEQMGIGKRLFEQFEWQKFEPHADWAEYVKDEKAPTSPAPYGPFATGIANGARIVYVPEPRAVKLRQLPPNEKQQISAFDPTTGKTETLAEEAGQQAENIEFRKPSSIQSDDWVIVIEPLRN